MVIRASLRGAGPPVTTDVYVIAETSDQKQPTKWISDFGHEHGVAGDLVESWKIIGALVIVCAVLTALIMLL